MGVWGALGGKCVLRILWWLVGVWGGKWMFGWFVVINGCFYGV